MNILAQNLANKNSRKCSRCKRIKLASEFTKRQSWCKECSTEYNMEIYRRRREKVLEFKRKGCERCGYNEDPVALDLHHPNGKDYSGGILNNWSRKTFEKELENLVVLCANCHRIIHKKKEKLFTQ